MAEYRCRGPVTGRDPKGAALHAKPCGEPLDALIEALPWHPGRQVVRCPTCGTEHGVYRETPPSEARE